MRKQTKIAALVSAAALLAIGASMTSFAATGGWNFDGEVWEWLDRDGNRVTEMWKTSNGSWYYLDEEGVMATDRVIDDGEGNIYYVDENGVRVTNRWVSVPNDDGIEPDGKEVDNLWYFFGDTGKAVRATNGEDKQVKTVKYNGADTKFIFDESGHMISGWTYIGDGDSRDIYYLGDEDEGWVHTGWQFLEPDIYMDPAGTTAYDDQVWFNFKDNGKARKANKSGATKDEYIDKLYYTFDHNGVLKTDWYSTTTLNDASAKEATVTNAFANVDGVKSAGWVYAQKTDDSGDYAWYYLIKINGHKTVPFNLSSASGSAARYIDNKTYLFNNKGEMMTGVVNVTSKADADTSVYTIVATTSNAKNNTDVVKQLPDGIYYFSKAAASQGSDGRMMTGKQSVDNDGDISYYYFEKNGKAVKAAVRDNVLYGDDGKRIQAEDGATNMVVRIEDEFDNGVTISGKLKKSGTLVVSNTGRIKKGTTVTIDGVKYQIGSDCMVAKAWYADDTTKTDQPSYYDAVKAE